MTVNLLYWCRQALDADLDYGPVTGCVNACIFSVTFFLSGNVAEFVKLPLSFFGF